MPAGYYKDGKDGRDEQGDQLSLYEMHQKRTTGFSKEEHKEIVTDAWRASDSSKAFVQALAEKGYLLATGKRPYVLVDFYGGMHALPKLETQKTPPQERHMAMTWARRLKRVFDIDIETCSQCGGAVKIIASIEDPAVIRKILAVRPYRPAH